jgi:hypothetical protein
MVFMGACGLFVDWLGGLECVSDSALGDDEALLVEVLRMHDSSLEFHVSKMTAQAELKKTI